MRAIIASVLAAGLLGLVIATPRAQTPAFDLVIRHGRIVDGTGSPWYLGDVAVRNDTIVRIAPRIDAPAARVIDAAGKIVAPGFIDLHTHARRGIFDVPGADNYVRQGVTTIMEGPDGSSPLPIKPFLDRIAALKVTPNFGLFVGQGTIRDEVIGPINRKATPAELEKMRGLVRGGMQDGAFGLSSGLFYVPGTFTPTDEVVELAKVAGRMGGIYISHMRDETNGILASVKETIEIGEKGGLPTQVTHHKVIGKANWGRAVDTLKLIDEARARGVDATMDQYPYTASATSIQAALMPAYALEGGRDAVLKRLQTPALRNELRKETARIIAEERGGGDPNNVQLSRCDWDHSLDGKRLGDVTKARGFEPTIDNAADTVFWIVEKGGCGGIFHAISEDDLQRILRHPATMIGSDGEVPIFGQASPHPRSYGTFVRVLGRYVRELKVITLEEAVRKMSAFPAQRIGLADRGVLREGMKADIAIFDAATVRDMATFDKPHQYAEGVTAVIVNGQVAFENGTMTPARPGRILLGPAARP
ncbi:MAG: N-acyl-D-amino-acid deacylase [Acidobacteria bacterium]|nr:N-acyl-D-amino-acid deacylase [Acidobacteriota bacterium]